MRFQATYNNNNNNKQKFDIHLHAHLVSTIPVRSLTSTRPRLYYQRSLLTSSFAKSPESCIQDQEYKNASNEAITSNDTITKIIKTTDNDMDCVTTGPNVLKKAAIVVVVHNPLYKNETQQLAQSLGLPVVNDAMTSLSELGYNNVNSSQTTTTAVSSIIAISIVPYQLDVIDFNDYAIGINVLEISDIDDNKLTMETKKVKKTRSDMNKPLIVDFLPPPSTKAGKRLIETQSSSNQPDLLQKAISFRKKTIQQSRDNLLSNNTITDDSGIIIYDVTAGLGRDSFIMVLSPNLLIDSAFESATQQKRVHMIERNPLLHTLLRDGLRRLKLIASLTGESRGKLNTFVGSGLSNPSTTIALAKKLSNTISLCDTPVEAVDVLSKLKVLLRHEKSNESIPAINQDCVDYEENSDSQQKQKLHDAFPIGQPDIIYIDPMFPQRKKSALVKKDMQILHALFSSSTNIINLNCMGTLDSAENDQVHRGNNNDSENPSSTSCRISKNIDDSTDEDDNERQLLLSALEVAKLRVIVKRPLHAMPLGYSVGDEKWRKSQSNCTKKGSSIPRPSHQINGSINRWDVYNLY
jgi:Putative SAM-dependent methyltransferase